MFRIFGDDILLEGEKVGTLCCGRGTLRGRVEFLLEHGVRADCHLGRNFGDSESVQMVFPGFE